MTPALLRFSHYFLQDRGVLNLEQLQSMRFRKNRNKKESFQHMHRPLSPSTSPARLFPQPHFPRAAAPVRFHPPYRLPPHVADDRMAPRIHVVVAAVCRRLLLASPRASSRASAEGTVRSTRSVPQPRGGRRRARTRRGSRTPRAARRLRRARSAAGDAVQYTLPARPVDLQHPRFDARVTVAVASTSSPLASDGARRGRVDTPAARSCVIIAPVNAAASAAGHGRLRLARAPSGWPAGWMAASRGSSRSKTVLAACRPPAGWLAESRRARC